VTGPPGPFWIELERVEARRGLAEYEKAELSDDERIWREEEERRSRGEKYLWWLDDSERAMMDRFSKPKAERDALLQSEWRKDAIVRKEGEHGDSVEEDEDEAVRHARKEASQHKQQQQQQQKS